ncbi:MAG TPA: TRAFs-binding domain-containing protein [Pyrinomonadaceae bacterium]|nr:TRAFs-binding domain-containing protein [Pyrinomonadaceae bacterium]
MPEKKTCFVVMGFGEKVDFETGRKLNLNASYENLIKPAVEAAGLECVRADEIAHSGVIDVPMYRQLLLADVVVADVSTANCNAFYELGVRHALRPYTTIIIAEDKFKFPFDIGHITVRTYRHLGEDIGASEARRFTADLSKAIQAIVGKEEPDVDSPVYTFLQRLRRLRLPEDLDAEGGAPPAPAAPAAPAEKDAPDLTHAALMQQVAEAKGRGDFVTAKALLSTVRTLMKGKNPDKPDDPYIVQQLALATYKSKLPTPQAALEEARGLLLTLDPATSNDTETLGLWGAVHKRLWDSAKDTAHLDEAVRGYERGFYLRNDYYNGINLAFILNVRAAHAKSRAEAVADFVQAERVRREVIDICAEEMKGGGPPSDEQKYWLLATWAEGLLGVGDEAGAQQKFQEASAVAPAGWMKDSTQEQMETLRRLLADSPLKYVKEDGE